MEAASQDQIAAATAYETLFVPALFQQWSPRVLDAADVQAGDRVLDVACGTGVLAREASLRVGATGAVVGLDLAQGMLSVAEQIAPTMDWQQGAAEALPFPDESFDAVVSQFGLMFFPDRVQALREMLRVSVPGGRLAVAVWTSLDRIPAVAKEVAVLERVAGSEAADALRAPFVLGDPNTLESLAEDAGFASIEVKTYEGEARFPSIRTLVEADLRGWLPIMGVVLEEDQIAQILEEADQDLREYESVEGQMVFDMPAQIVTGTKRREKQGSTGDA
jgi:ubiquinone/menaquinone biosynthesis C-methylase UbiE